MLSLKRMWFDPEYKKKWNIHNEDFVQLYKDEELLRDTPYRVSGIWTPDFKKDRYFILLKYKEAFYKDEITTDEKRKRHLGCEWCILDSEGIEKVVVEDSIRTPYLVKDSIIYVIDNYYYNIETRELYCQSFSDMRSSEFLFLDNAYDKDKSRRGVFKINKNDGTFEIFNK